MQAAIGVEFPSHLCSPPWFVSLLAGPCYLQGAVNITHLGPPAKIAGTFPGSLARIGAIRPPDVPLPPIGCNRTLPRHAVQLQAAPVGAQAAPAIPSTGFLPPAAACSSAGQAPRVAMLLSLHHTQIPVATCQYIKVPGLGAPPRPPPNPHEQLIRAVCSQAAHNGNLAAMFIARASPC